MVPRGSSRPRTVHKMTAKLSTAYASALVLAAVDKRPRYLHLVILMASTSAAAACR